MYEETASLFDYFPDDSFLLVSEYSRIKERVRASQWQWNEEVKALLEEGVLCRGLDRYTKDADDLLGYLQQRYTVYLDTFMHGGFDTPIRMAASASARK